MTEIETTGPLVHFNNFYEHLLCNVRDNIPQNFYESHLAKTYKSQQPYV